ncbi:beta-N-acetylhexosaminidase [Rickettsiales endosymbiont of Stachyamoeba lipophora]|uniref:beta-N-acetylhexosaminidase n=1 Tax=Rickettsiales endosymbiont of Stachyamoeba lipophora TaxID=2486578 RepID=UPI000F64592E|nr:beta-N-acetylhexosaminidase [Rickettsiales endosymbiont of Stachyamoeba lipophora]AZL15358.1 beta-N-acetylhexosaminidase [Rickettsiales endosymbiont of Stachyamoeba lipophora]
MKNVIYGLASTQLLHEEAEFIKKADPFGIILFTRNIESKEQVQQLITELKDTLSRDINIFIDQEGGRVARLKAPMFRKLPAAKFFADLYAKDSIAAINASFLNHYLIGLELKTFLINGCFAPVADLYYDYTHQVIGDRSFGNAVEQATKLAQAAHDGLIKAGVMACIKHLPGHGRATVDSHLELPRVTASIAELEATDFKVFKELKANFAMTAHIIYDALDPEHPATTSKQSIEYIKNNLFNGIIVSDDIGMKALQGDFKTITKQVIDAGVDIVLHCSGNLEEMKQIDEAAIELESQISQALTVEADNNLDYQTALNQYTKIIEPFLSEIHYA